MTKKHSGKQTVTLMTDAYSQMLTFKSYQTMSLLFSFFFSFHVRSLFSVIDCFMSDIKSNAWSTKRIMGRFD